MLRFHRSSTFSALILVSLPLAARAQTTECVNQRPDGLVQGTGGLASCSMSAAGDLVAFSTRGAALISGAPTDYESIFVRDRTSGALSMVSVDATGVAANAQSAHPFLSADGRFVAFTSEATNLVANDTNGVGDVFLHDRVSFTTSIVSLAPNGALLDSASRGSGISADGRFVVFETSAAVAPSDSNGVSDVYVRDVVGGTTWRASVSSSGAQSSGASTRGAISADGSRVVFVCAGDDLWPGDTNGVQDVFVHDRASGVTELVSRSSAGALADGDTQLASISGDGTTVAFVSRATNLDPAVSTPLVRYHVFTRELASGTTRMCDVDGLGAPGDGIAVSPISPNQIPRMSHDARFLVFSTRSTNLVAGVTSAVSSVYKLDRIAGSFEQVSVGACGQQLESPGGADAPWVSDDGTFVVFRSGSENLLAGDGSLVNQADVFVRDPTKPPACELICAGADSAPCPCGQAPALRGCPNTEFAAGLFASGEASLGADTLRLGGYGVPVSFTTSCIYFQGTQATGGGAGVAFGDGVRCVGGQVTRLALEAPQFLSVIYYPEPGDPSISFLGGVSAAGTTRYYQLWYPQADSFCTPSQFNFTNAVRVVWAP